MTGILPITVLFKGIVMKIKVRFPAEMSEMLWFLESCGLLVRDEEECTVATITRPSTIRFPEDWLQGVQMVAGEIQGIEILED
jgi:hypothetical protein